MNNVQKKIDSLFSAALSLQDAGENNQAIDLLNEIIKLDPDYIDAYVLKGVILQDEEDFESAESAFRLALEISPKHPEALQALGLFLVSQERYEEAISYLQKHLEIIPDDQSSLNGIIKAFLKLSDRLDDVLKVLRKAWVHSKNPDIGHRYGRHLTFSNEKEKAYQVYDQVLEISKTSKTLTDYAFSCYFFNDYDTAIGLLKEAVNIDPSYVKAWRMLADCHKHKDETSKAIEAVETAISLYPNDYRNWRLKTDVFIQIKDYDKALYSAQKGIDLLINDQRSLEKLKKSLINPFFQKIFILFKLEKIDEALETAKIARTLIPQNHHFFLYPALKLAKFGRYEEAYKILDSTDDPAMEERFETHRYRFILDQGRVQEAKDYLESRIKDDPENKVEKFVDMGVEEYYDRDRQTAISIYQQLLSFDAENPRLRNNLGYMLLGEGNFKEAESLFLELINNGVFEINSFISRCNLAYIYSIQGKFDEVFQLVDEVLNSEFSAEDATLRVPFWLQGKIHTDPAQYPGRSITLEMAAFGCGLSCALALDDMEKAEDFIDQLFIKEFEDPLPLICEGCVQAAKNNEEEAIDAFTQAFEMSTNEDEKEILEEWVEMLEGKKTD